MPILSRDAETFTFDSDAWRHLLGRTDSEATDALATAYRLTSSGAMVVLATVPLLIELRGLKEHEPDLHKEAQGKLLSMAGGRLLLATDERIQLERRLGRRLISTELVYPSEVTRDILAELASDSDVDSDLSGIKQSFGLEQQLVRGAVRTLFDKAGKRRLLAGWQQDLHDDILERCQKELLASAGVGANHPHAVAPSLWHLRSYEITRDGLVSLEAEGRSKIDTNDKVDERHYADAAYSTALVSDDRGLKRIAARCPAPNIRVVTSDDWVRSVLSG
jgi:hypothetical protein